MVFLETYKGQAPHLTRQFQVFAAPDVKTSPPSAWVAAISDMRQ